MDYSINDTEQCASQLGKKSSLIPYIKLNPRWLKNVNTKIKIIKNDYKKLGRISLNSVIQVHIFSTYKVQKAYMKKLADLAS